MSTKPLKIIVADDDEEDIIFVRESLNENHFPAEIFEAANGELLLSMLRKRSGDAVPTQPDLILMDINMPRKNGLDTLKEIKADANLRGIPVVILSTSKSPKDIRLAKELGASYYLTKPQTAREWHLTIQQLGVYWNSGLAEKH